VSIEVKNFAGGVGSGHIKRTNDACDLLRDVKVTQYWTIISCFFNFSLSDGVPAKCHRRYCPLSVATAFDFSPARNEISLLSPRILK